MTAAPVACEALERATETRTVAGLGPVVPHVERCHCGAAAPVPDFEDHVERAVWAQNLSLVPWACPTCSALDGRR